MYDDGRRPAFLSGPESGMSAAEGTLSRDRDHLDARSSAVAAAMAIGREIEVKLLRGREIPTRRIVAEPRRS